MEILMPSDNAKHKCIQNLCGTLRKCRESKVELPKFPFFSTFPWKKQRPQNWFHANDHMFCCNRAPWIWENSCSTKKKRLRV